MVFRSRKENPWPCVLLFKTGSNLSEHRCIDTTPEISRRGDLQASYSSLKVSGLWRVEKGFSKYVKASWEESEIGHRIGKYSTNFGEEVHPGMFAATSVVRKAIEHRLVGTPSRGL